MSSGSWYVGYNPVGTGPFSASKTWTGGSDRKKVAQLAYSMQHFRMAIKPSRYDNKYYPYVPPYFEEYSPRSLGTFPDRTKFATVSSNTYIAALNDVAEKIRGHDFNAAVFGAELKESVDTVTRSALAFKKLIAACFSLDIPRILRCVSGLPGNKESKDLEKAVRLRDVGGVVLAMRYGWLPLLQDVWEACKAIEAWQALPTRCITFRGKSTEKTVLDIRLPTGSLSAFPVTCRSTVYYTVVLRERVSLHRKLGLNDPASVIWEKIPFSFIWDWWMPVGSFLSAFGFFTGLDLSYARTTLQKIEYRNVPMYPPAAWPPDKTYPWKVNGSFTGAQTKMVREVGTSLSIPLPSFSSMAKAFSAIHLQNAGALVLALFQGSPAPAGRIKRRQGKPRKPKEEKYWSNDQYAH